MLDLARLQDLADDALIILLDIQALLVRGVEIEDEWADLNDGIEGGVVDPTYDDEQWLHNELVNNGDL